jgi:hypothetical protein
MRNILYTIEKRHTIDLASGTLQEILIRIDRKKEIIIVRVLLGPFSKTDEALIS